MGWLRNLVFRRATVYLTRPLAAYSQRAVLDSETLRGVLREGDVLLVEGDQRVSEVIKFLTQSSWSHAALYVGDSLAREPLNDEIDWGARFGPGASHLVIEAVLEEGVTVNPVSKYAGSNVRICRPIGLQQEDFQKILSEIREQLGSGYDVKHVLELARYFFPVQLIPTRFRRKALELGSTLTHDVICSTLIARAFQNVGFPILPTISEEAEAAEAAMSRSWRDRLRRRRQPYSGLFRRKRTNLITPRDFDLSPYFQIVKPDISFTEPFDYRRIQWEDSDESGS